MTRHLLSAPLARVVLVAAFFALPSQVAGQAPVGTGAPAPAGPVRRMPNGVPDLGGFFLADHGGANWGLAPHPVAVDLTPPGRGVIIDPPDRTLPYQPWALAEQKNRALPERGYDDPTAHCFVAAGVPRSLYVPSPFHILQTPDHVVFLHERMAWRSVALNRRTHPPDSLRFWQGDSVGRWEGDTLVVETTNFNGKTWLNEIGDVISHAEHVVEQFTAVDGDTINYQATVTDPIVFTRPWTIALPFKRQSGELLESACHEDNQDLKHLKDIRDAARESRKNGGR